MSGTPEIFKIFKSPWILLLVGLIRGARSRNMSGSRSRNRSRSKSRSSIETMVDN